jgi:hypothetical protein
MDERPLALWQTSRVIPSRGKPVVVGGGGGECWAILLR